MIYYAFPKILPRWRKVFPMIEFMKQTARQAGAIALADMMRLDASAVHTKATAFDLVTDTDRKVERFITERIAAFCPEAGVYGEETGKNHAEREFCFIIDPIDGTASFVHHLPNWCVSIGLYRNGKPFAGVVYQPTAGSLYYAESGKGAFLNGVRIHVSSFTSLGDAIVGTGFSCLRAQWKEENNLRFFSRIAPLVSDVRKYGSAALDCCNVANGSFSAFWELFLQPYDIAAGLLIAKEAGAVVTDLFGGEDYPECGFLCGSDAIVRALLPFFHDYKHRKC